MITLRFSKHFPEKLRTLLRVAYPAQAFLQFTHRLLEEVITRGWRSLMKRAVNLAVIGFVLLPKLQAQCTR